MTPNSLSDIACGRSQASLERLLRIASALNISFDKLLEGTLNYVPQKPDCNVSPEIIKALHSSTIEQKESLIEILNEYVNKVKK